MNNIYDALVIGGGPAGIFASFLGYHKGLKMILIEANKTLGGQPAILYSHKAIYDIPGQYGIKAHDYVNNLVDQLENHSECKIITDTKIESFEYKNECFFVKLLNQNIIYAKNIIIATGPGLLKPNTIDDIRGVNDSTNIDYVVIDINKYKDKNVVILGGGDSAVDWANEIALKKIAKSVSLIHRRNELRANGKNVKVLNEYVNVNIYLNYNVDQIEKNKLLISHNDTTEKKEIYYDNLIVQFGQKIDLSLNELFRNVKKNKAGRIPVKINQLTNLKNIYAIGNICIYKDKPSSIIAAHGEASRAIRSIINNCKKYD